MRKELNCRGNYLVYSINIPEIHSLSVTAAAGTGTTVPYPNSFFLLPSFLSLFSISFLLVLLLLLLDSLKAKRKGLKEGWASLRRESLVVIADRRNQ